MQTLQFPPALPLLVMAAYAIVSGYLANRFLRWEQVRWIRSPGSSPW